MESKNEAILIKTNIKKIKRAYKENSFSSIIKYNLTKYIMNYLDLKSKYNFAKTCTSILNNFIDYENSKTFDIIADLPKKFPLIERTFDEKNCDFNSDYLWEIKALIKFKDSEEDISEYESPEMRKNYLIIENRRISFISLGNCFNWPWKKDKHYWNLNKKYNTNYINYNYWHLDDVSWIHNLLIFRNIPKSNYKLFLNMRFDNENFKGQLKLVISYGNHIIYVIDNWPSKYEINEFHISKDGKNKEDFICVIERKDFTNVKNEYPGLIVEGEGDDYKYKKKEDEFYVEFMHENINIKKGWFYGGAKLEEIKDEELEEAFKAENEIRKLTGLKYNIPAPNLIGQK